MTQIVCRARRPSQRFRTRKAFGRIERHRHADNIGKRGGNVEGLALLAHVPTWLGVSPRQTKEQEGTQRVDIAANARLAKTILLGRRIGTRSKLDRVGVGSVTPYPRNPQIDNHQRRKRHAGID